MVAVESKTQALYELTGVVSRVYTRETPAVFDVITTDGTFRCRCPFFKPVEDGDKITGIVSQDPSGSYFNYMREPYVKVSFDTNSIKRCFLKALRYQHWSSAAAEYLYDRLVASCRLCKLLRVMPKLGEISSDSDAKLEPAPPISDEVTSYDVAAYLGDAALKWKQTKDSNIVKAITAGTTLDAHHIELLLTWWHKERNLRKLYLLGLTNKEILDCHKPLEVIYEICVGKTDADTGNPFRLPAIPMEKCYAIMRMQGVEPNAVQVACGNIVRKIYEYNQVNAWTCTPLWLLQRIYSTLHIYRETLEKEYEIHFDCVSAYLDYPYKVETQVAAYLDTLIKSTARNFNAKAELPEVEAETFKFAHCKTLDEDQKRAITGAIEHDICIITGGPGSGKCLGLETPVLDAYGGIKLAKDVQVGDYLIGDDSTVRLVTSVTTGIDHMYEIIPSKGKSFICNAPHILTLRGIVPYVTLREDRTSQYIVRYSTNGHSKSKAFTSYELAEAFISSLPEDIFDIPLNEYLVQNKKFREKTYLFHTGVDFPHQDVQFDPYMIGYWLGDGDSAGAVITTADIEVVEYFDRELGQYNLELSRSMTESSRYGIRGIGTRYKKCNILINVLRSLNMLDNKHIPLVYKINSRENRLKLLAGIIDSDGYVYSDGTCIEISQKSDQLADDIEYLAFSLGFMITRTKTEKGCMHNGTMRYGLYNRMTIFGEGLEQIPTIIARKKISSRSQTKRATCQGFTVKYLGLGQYAGFTITGNGRFLLGDFTVTHNTTVIGEIVRRLELLEIGFSAGSFTGKAVARLQDILGSRSAKTLDRLISQAGTIVPFKHLIIDEISMVTSELFFRLISAFKFKFKITLVGDEDQLGPISWGNLFSQLLIAGRIPTYRLTHNHRLIPHAITAGDHSQTSPDVAPGELEFDRIILENSMALVSKTRNLSEPLVFRDGIGFSQVEGGIPIVETMVNMLARAGIPASDITVISPFNEYLSPINAIFERVYLSESKRMMDLRKEIWHVGNRVMMLVNNYDINVMNGEEGLVVDVNDTGVVCKFKDGAEHTFKYAEPEGTSRKKRYNQMPTEPSTGEDVDGKDLTTEHITKSFAITVHKAQGSEQQFVIVYIPLRVNAHGKGSKFLNINLLYTAMTRTKRALWLVGSPVAIAQATCQVSSRRYDNLASRLKVSRDADLETKLSELCRAPVELAVTGDDEFPDEEGGGCYLPSSYFVGDDI